LLSARNIAKDTKLEGKGKKSSGKNKSARGGPASLLWHSEKVETQVQKRSWVLSEVMGFGTGAALRVIASTLAAIEREAQTKITDDIRAEQIVAREKKKKAKQLTKKKTRELEQSPRKEAMVPPLTQAQLEAMSVEQQIEYAQRWSAGEMGKGSAEQKKDLREKYAERKKVEQHANVFRSALSRHYQRARNLAKGKGVEGNEGLRVESLARSRDWEGRRQWKASMRHFYYDKALQETFTCGVCFEEGFKCGSEGVCLPCGHDLCYDCWKSYLHSQISDGKSVIRCPGFRCKEFIEESMVMSICELVDKDNETSDNDDSKATSPASTGSLYRRYRSWVTSMYIKCKGWRWCPGERCDMVAVAGDMTGTVYCSPPCLSVYCFECGGSPHWPIPCDLLRIYEGPILEKKRAKAKNSKSYRTNLKNRKTEISVSLKNCPKCRTSWYKDGGCNHFTCPCGHHFCWICLGPWSEHSNFYKCTSGKGEVKASVRVFREDETWEFGTAKMLLNEVFHLGLAQAMRVLCSDRNRCGKIASKWKEADLDTFYIAQVAQFGYAAHSFVRSVYAFNIIVGCAVRLVDPKDARSKGTRDLSSKLSKTFVAAMKSLEQLEYFLDILDQILEIVPLELFSTRDRYQINDLVRTVQKYAVETAGMLEVAYQGLMLKDGSFCLKKNKFVAALKVVGAK